MTTTKPTSIKLPADIAQAVTEAAEAAGITRNAWLVAAVRAALAGATTSQTTSQTIPEVVAAVTQLAARVSALEAMRQPQPVEPAPPTERQQPQPVEQQRPRGNATHSPEAVAAIIQLRAEGVSIHGIAARLNEQDLMPAKGRRWTAAIVRYVLTTPTYKAQRLAAGLAE